MLKTAEATGLPQRTITCQIPKSSTASSSAAAQNFQSVTRPPELPASTTAARTPVPDKTSPPATRKVHSIAIIVDDFDKCEEETLFSTKGQRPNMYTIHITDTSVTHHVMFTVFATGPR